MAGRKFGLSSEKQLYFPYKHGEKLISLKDGTCALLYIYSLTHGGSFSSDEVAHALSVPENEVLLAVEKLERLGLMASLEGEKVYPKEELPQYKTADIITKNRDSGEFAAVIEEAQRILGKTLSGADLSCLFGIYDRLGLGAELIFMLINHCAEETRKRYGPSRLPTMHAIEKEAFIWINEEVLTMEQAEAYLSRKKERGSKISEIKRLLQIDRNFSASEKSYVESWVAMSFAIDAIALAYDKTVMKTGKLAWKYMDSILQSWHSKNLHTQAEVEQGDGMKPRYRQAPAQNVPQQAPIQRVDDSDLLERILNS